MNSNTIHIAYALDDRFAELTCVSIVSLLRNTAQHVTFHIIESRLSDVHAEKITNLIDSYAHGVCKYYHIDIDESMYITTQGSKVTKETYASGMLPNVLYMLDRVIWLDGDTIIEEDIAQIWDIDLGEYYAAMVPDTSCALKEAKKAVLEMSDWYFNSGVMLMDLAKLRAFKFVELLETQLPVVHKSVLESGIEWYRVQDMINYILKGHIKRLPIRFNSYLWYKWGCDIDGLTISEVADAFERPAIVHFIGDEKPTHITRKLFLDAHWYRYYHYKPFTPYADNGDAALIEQYHIRRNNLMNSLLLPDYPHYLSLIQHLKKELFEQAYASIAGNIGNRKLVIWGYNDVTAFLVGFLTGKGLTVVDVVDGTSVCWDCFVFDKRVKPADSLRDSPGEYYVLLDMRNYDVARQVMATLQSWGYAAEEYYHVYAPIWEGAGELEDS